MADYKYITHVNLPHFIGELVRSEPAFDNVKYVGAFPHDLAVCPCIQWERVSRVPGSQNIETLKPRHRETIDVGGGALLDISSQWQTTVMQFNICATSSEEAEDLSSIFENFLDNNIGNLLENGISFFTFQEELKDYMLPKSEGVHTRSLRYIARTEKLFFDSNHAIEEIRLRVFENLEEDVNTITRGSTPYDTMEDLFIGSIVAVTTESPSGIARDAYYVLGLDYLIIKDPITHQTAIWWTDAGRHPSPGELYYVRYYKWAGFTRMYIPYR